MKKEILKYENLSEDIMYLYDVHFNRLHFLFSAIILFPFIFISLIMMMIEGTVGLIFLLVVLILNALPYLITYIKSKRIKAIIRKNGYSIINGKLLSINSHDAADSPHRQFSNFWLEIIFSVGDWEIGGRKNFSYRFNTGDRHLYRWSKDLAMTFDGLCNTSCSGDEFYIVVDNVTKNILYAYSKKFFILENELKG
jgi:hypothetical protein